MNFKPTAIKTTTSAVAFIAVILIKMERIRAFPGTTSLFDTIMANLAFRWPQALLIAGLIYVIWSLIQNKK